MTRATVHRRVLALCVAAFAFTLSGTAVHATDAKALPAYRLEVGQELTYKDDNESKRGEGKQNSNSVHTDWKASVVGKNKDGSSRVIVQAAKTYIFDGKPAGKPRSSFAYCDVFNDGRVLPNPTLTVLFDPTVLFPRLPENAKELADGWESLRLNDDGRCAYKVEAQPKSANADWTITATTKTPLDDIYLVTRKGTITFDLNRGLVTKATRETTQDWGIKSQGKGTLVLVSVDKHDAAWAKKLLTDADRYFEASRIYEAKTDEAPKDAKTAQELLDEAREVLKTAEAEVSLPLFKDELKDSLKSHEQMAKYALDDATRRAKVVGHPAAEFEATDLKGKSHTLKDYKGKVVVLDFWYRGCGWCMRAMPQVKQVAAEFKGEPVAVIGMNTDHNDADARFVVDKLGLDYTTLKIDHKVVQKYGVQGFPTMVIIDRQGNIHGLHVGYTPNLQREVGEIVRQLLAKR
jgi:peroxiredoxin